MRDETFDLTNVISVGVVVDATTIPADEASADGQLPDNGEALLQIDTVTEQ